MLCSVYTTIAGEYCDPPFCTPIGSSIPPGGSSSASNIASLCCTENVN